jgi:uncharacterized protein YfeS
MTNQELQKKSEELEQTLKMQLSLAKNESQDYLKIGAVVLGTALVAAATVKIVGSKKKKKTEKVLKALEKEGLLDEEIERKLTQQSQPGLLGRIGMLLLPIAINYGKGLFLQRISQHQDSPPIKDAE